MNQSGEKGAILGVLISALSLIAIGAVLIFFVFGKIVPPSSIGLRQNYFNIPGLLKDGYQDKGLPPGLHWKIPGISTILLMPRDFQFVQLNDEEKEGELVLSQLEIPTTDGSKVKADMTLVLRFFERPGESRPRAQKIDQSNEKETDAPIAEPKVRYHGGPAHIVNTYTTSQDKQLGTFTRKAEDSLKRWLSGLSTTDYYNPVLREKATLGANEDINAFANGEGIELWATLIRRYRYSEQKIDDQIFAKNLQDATERLNAAQGELAEARAKTEETRAFWDAQKIKLLKEESNAKVLVLDREAKQYEAEKIATGNKLVDVAIGEVEQHKNQAYAGPGGSVHIARQLLPLVSSLQGGIVSDLNPFDVQGWLKRLAVNESGR